MLSVLGQGLLLGWVFVWPLFDLCQARLLAVVADLAMSGHCCLARCWALYDAQGGRTGGRAAAMSGRVSVVGCRCCCRCWAVGGGGAGGVGAGVPMVLLLLLLALRAGCQAPGR